MTMQSIQIFTSADGEAQLEVALEQETAWLSQDQMCELFGREHSVITKHIGNVFKEGELERDSVCAKFAHTADDGKTYQTQFYNLDVIISVGYRVKSPRGVQFRQWATRVLRQHLVDGYTLNQRRLAERGVEFEQAVNLLSRVLANQQLVSGEGQAVVKVIADYARSWSLLQGYDEQSLVEQGFGDELFYPNVASRAAHLLYFVIKNHPLADGNKRTGSFLFLWYLRLNQHLLARPVEQLINDNTLVALRCWWPRVYPRRRRSCVSIGWRRRWIPEARAKQWITNRYRFLPVPMARLSLKWCWSRKLLRR